MFAFGMVISGRVGSGQIDRPRLAIMVAGNVETGLLSQHQMGLL